MKINTFKQLVKDNDTFVDYYKVSYVDYYDDSGDHDYDHVELTIPPNYPYHAGCNVEILVKDIESASIKNNEIICKRYNISFKTKPTIVILEETN